MQKLFENEEKEYRSPLLRRSIAGELRREMADTFLYRPWSLWLERVTERQEKEMDLLVGQVLVRVKFEAAYREEGGAYAMLKCMVIQIDGQEVEKKEQETKSAVFESKQTPTTEEQTDVFQQALENWGIRGKAVPVTEKYVAGHLRLVALRKRSTKKKGV